MSYTNGLDDPTLYFNTKLYTGNGSTQSITGVGFQPDWIWLKSRTTAEFHTVYDSVRGSASNYKQLYTNSTNAEVTPGTAGLTAIGTDGFTLGANDNSNASSQNFVSWNWLAGGTASSNTDGSITSSVSANTTAGFSIVSYTGTKAVATVGHGLGAVPKMIIIKNRDDIDGWGVYHVGVGNTGALELNSTSATITSTSFWNDTTPSSSVFTVKSDDRVNPSSQNMIAYCFAEKKGFSKFGSYTGNGSTDGTFIYTGFKPAFVILKRTDTTNNWHMGDNKRLNPYNPLSTQLYPNLNNSETENADLDFLSNGFKLRVSSAFGNASGGSYIYMGFAESPFVTSTGIPTTAR